MTRAHDDYDDEDELHELVLSDIFGIGEDQGDQDAEENNEPVSHYPCPLSELLSKEEYLESIEDREILEPLASFYNEPVAVTMQMQWEQYAVRATAYPESDTVFAKLGSSNPDGPSLVKAKSDGSSLIRPVFSV
ncbi:MAG TPA: hypothetical protein DEA55_05950 [Rhodospirillaceae bacterium]|nr:hypothetical protein [Rhodospirillaceae bacterium]